MNAFLLSLCSNSAVTIKDSLNVPVIVIDDVSTNFLNEGMNVLGIAGFVLAILSLFITYVTYKAQKQTELHTTNAPKSAQIGKIKDLSRHFYRNLVCICAFVFKYQDDSNYDENNERINYPSESNVLKLKTLPDEIIYDIDEEEKSYSERHEFKLLLRNFNTEVEIASEHFSRKYISADAINQDIDNLIFKQFYLVFRSYKIRNLLDRTEYLQIVAESLCEIIKEHFRKLEEGSSLESGNKNLHYVNKILKNDNVETTFCKIIDSKGALMRSYSNIVKLVTKHLQGKQSPVIINGIVFSNMEGNEIAVNKKLFIEYISNEQTGSTNKNDLAGFIGKISGISSLEKFKTINKHRDNAAEIYNNISAYLDFLNREEWKFNELILIIVTIDCILEMNKIGMVNFSSLSR